MNQLISQGRNISSLQSILRYRKSASFLSGKGEIIILSDLFACWVVNILGSDAFESQLGALQLDVATSFSWGSYIPRLLRVVFNLCPTPSPSQGCSEAPPVAVVHCDSSAQLSGRRAVGVGVEPKAGHWNPCGWFWFILLEISPFFPIPPQASRETLN